MTYARLILLALLFCASPALAQNIYSFRAVTEVDDPNLITVRNALVAGNLAGQGQSAWTAADVVRYRGEFTKTQVVSRNGVVIGFAGSMDWSQPGHEAIVAPVDLLHITPTLTLAQRRDGYRYLIRALVNQLLASRSTNGVTPSFLSFEWPVQLATLTPVLTDLGCQQTPGGSVDGVPVTVTLTCDLAALDAALKARGI